MSFGVPCSPIIEHSECYERKKTVAEPKEPSLQGLNALVGEWDTEATHPMVPSTVVHGLRVAGR
jgi:hypothetical protein